VDPEQVIGLIEMIREYYYLEDGLTFEGNKLNYSDLNFDDTDSDM
jgi:hypothetical protein